MIPYDPHSATLRLRTLADTLAVAVDDDDAAAALALTASIRACCDGLARGLVTEVFTLRPADAHDALRAELYAVRMERMHLLGSPRDYSRLCAAESALVAQLQAVHS